MSSQNLLKFDEFQQKPDLFENYKLQNFPSIRKCQTEI